MTDEKEMPEEIMLGMFYAPAPMSEEYFSVIDAETKAVPLYKAKYIRADLHAPDARGGDVEYIHTKGNEYKCNQCGRMNYVATTLIISAAPKQPDIAGWQPIEECCMPPEDEIVILAWKSTIKPFVFDSARLPDWEMEIRPYCINGSGGAKSYHGQATHWMPLPQPPKENG